MVYQFGISIEESFLSFPSTYDERKLKMNNSYNFSFLTDTESEEVQQHIAFEKRESKLDKEVNNVSSKNQDTLLKPLFSRELVEL